MTAVARQARLVPEEVSILAKGTEQPDFKLWLTSNLLCSQFWEGIFLWGRAGLGRDLISYLSLSVGAQPQPLIANSASPSPAACCHEDVYTEPRPDSLFN